MQFCILNLNLTRKSNQIKIPVNSLITQESVYKQCMLLLYIIILLYLTDQATIEEVVGARIHALCKWNIVGFV